MATEKLIVELDARTGKLESDLESVDKKLKGLDTQTKKNDKSLRAFGDAAKGLGAAVAVAGAALSSFIVLAAKSRQELEVLSTTAKTTVDDFSALSYATKQYGLDAKGTADAMNDVIERLAEFSVGDGAGAFDDFAQAMNLSKTEAMELADSLKDLTGEEALRVLTKQMEDAGVSSAEMTFVMKSLSNDLEYINPLFKDNAKILDEMKGKFDEVNGSISITQTEAEGLKEAASNFDLMAASAGKASNKIAASLAPAFNNFVEAIYRNIPDATTLVTDFINSFTATDELNDVGYIDKRMAHLQESISGAMKTISEKQNSGSLLDSFFDPTALIEAIGQWSGELEKLKERKEELVAEDLAREEEKNERLLELEIAKNERLAEIEAERRAQQLEAEAEQKEKFIEIDQEAFDVMDELRKESLAKQKKAKQIEQDMEMSNARAIISIGQSLAGDNEALNNALFLASQALSMSEVFFNTQAASMRALAELGPVAGAPVAASIETNGYLRMAAIAASSLGSLAGGSSSSSVNTTTTAPPSQYNPETGEQEQSSVNVDAQDSSNQSNAIVIKFEGNGDDVTEAIAKNMKVMEVNGQL